MGDINKYLESQLALAKQRVNKNHNKNGVSEKSKTAAELISKKQSSVSFGKGCSKAGQNSKEAGIVQKSQSITAVSDEDSEYIPSGDEEELHIAEINPFLASSSRSRQNVKKIADDGDAQMYDDRIKQWRDALTIATTSKYDGSILTADIQYVLDSNANPDEKHELQNGLLVPNFIWKQLYKFQRTGVKWLWELHQVQAGGMLGDEMGLGKTIQIIAFLAGLSNTDMGSWGGLGPSIIVAPATVIYQWVSHFHFWCPHLRVAVLHHSGSHAGNHNKLIRDLHDSHGIVLITYAGIVKYSKDLMSRKWHYIILDEGHKIRNPDTQVSKLVKKFETPHKLLITGSPMQNNLQELWSLFDFMRPGLLGTYNAFMEHFAQPITQGGYANATEFQEATAMEIAKALKIIITPYMLRRTKSEVQEHIKLPEKNEQVLFCALTREQRDLYMGYLMSTTVRSILDKENKYGEPLRARMLVALSTLRKICNHPDLYLYEAQEDLEAIDEEKFGHWKRSGKMTVVNSLLKIWQKQGHRALIFSQSRAMLCVLEQYLQSQNFKYLKMDGSVLVSQRQSLIKTFNENAEYLVFLSTTRVGGLGVNLTGADRVIVYDPDWNPATDDQAKERAWRIGQERTVTVYRLLCAGTIEEKIYQRQIFKHFLSNKILVDPNQKNVLTTSTLQGLFNYEEPNCEGDTETASLFKHTKVNVNDPNKNYDIKLNEREIKRKKIEAMKRMAKAISMKISKVVNDTKQDTKDPREEYKKKRELLLNPPQMQVPEINMVDDKITVIPFDSIMSELDIINKHSKKDYEENLLKEVLKTQEEEEVEDGEIIDEQTEKNNSVKSESVDEEVRVTASVKNYDGKQLATKKKKTKKRRHSVSETEVENLVAIKKVKRKKHKEEKDARHNDDDYVLSKLFAKSSVKSALQHDEVIGLAEKEKRHKLKEEAAKKARDAIRAIKFSYK
uniref:DNA repair and recombination protein RAD54-like n=1 Tax=Biston betularia TaxID=82595 RepID=E3UKJ6_BISBE|nr:cockayne syndrome protein [Biston betularia]